MVMIEAFNTPPQALEVRSIGLDYQPMIAEDAKLPLLQWSSGYINNESSGTRDSQPWLGADLWMARDSDVQE